MNMLVSILVIAGLLFGGGASVRAAQNDLPNEPLYALKLWSEDLGLQLQKDPEQKVERLMDLAQVRVQEMTRLADANKNVPDQARQRLEQHIQQALQICATMDDPVMDRTLLRVRDQLQQQGRDMERLQLHAMQNEQPILLQTRTMLRQRLQLVDQGLLNHEMFRYTVSNGFRFETVNTVTPPAQNGNGVQVGQPTLVPGGPNTDPGGQSYGPGEPNTDPGGPNLDPGGPNVDATPSSSTGGGWMGGNGTGGGSGGSGTSGNDSGGNETGGKNDGGTGTGGGGGGGGSGSGGQGGKP